MLTYLAPSHVGMSEWKKKYPQIKIKIYCNNFLSGPIYALAYMVPNIINVFKGKYIYKVLLQHIKRARERGRTS